MKEVKVKPLLACEVPLDEINFPVYASTKLDGVRALIIDGIVYSRSLKPIRNKHVQKLFGKKEFEGFDGELVVGDIYAKDVFQKTTSGVMSEDGEPDVKFYVFDLWNHPTTSYERRQTILRVQLKNYKTDNVLFLGQKYCNTCDDVNSILEEERIKNGEGLILRNPEGIYKYGRSTPKQQLSVKVKFFEQEEFEVVGFEERMHNTNEQTTNELGYAERSSAKDGLVPMNTLGSIVLKYGDAEFRCGTGFNDKQRKEIWENKDKYLGKLASIRYMSVGQKLVPRVPSFIGWRHEDDVS